MNVYERLNIDKGLFLAPMEDVTDISFRLLCKKFGADLVFTEFVNADGLVRSKKPAKTHAKMILHPEEHPIGIQIYGGDIETMIPAAEMAAAREPELIDINAGCWVKKVAKRGAGAGLLRDLPYMVKMAGAIVKTVDLPVTVKTRLGWDQDSIQIVELAKMLEDVGVQALTVHCRTRAQGHSGTPDWSWIPKIKSAVSIPVVLNGGVMTAEDVKSAFDQTGCDAVMIARGAITNPWIFRQAKEFMATGKVTTEPCLDERIHVCLELLQLAVRYKGERRAVLEMRKHYSGFFRNVHNIKYLRMRLMEPETYSEVEEILLQYLKDQETRAA
ncbi:MAG: tRNA dihydrouridine synthase DusB [Chlorobi bacterium]|nr:tRNA dihydrouridine synthase DusB [Chlorobiota bacterium]